MERVQDWPDSTANSDPCWRDLPFQNIHQNFLAPGMQFKAWVAVLLAPLVVALFYGMLPHAAQRKMSTLTGAMLLISAASGTLFLVSLVYFRRNRRRRQLALNASLVEAEPERFVLYLRSFRRSGALFVPNHLPKLVDRRLMGNFWDVELALSLCLAEKLPLVSMGVRSEGLGSMQLQSDEASWRDTFARLAHQCAAIFLVLDERPSTIWEFETILASSELRRKLIFMMAPEQFGWWRRIRGLPTVRESWEGLVRQVSTQFALPAYSPDGQLMLVDDAGTQPICFDLQNFHPRQVIRVTCTAIQRSRDGLTGDAVRATVPSEGLAHPNDDLNQGWRAFVDPLWPVMYVASAILANIVSADMVRANPGIEIPLFAASMASLATVAMNMHAFTMTRTALSVTVRQMRLRRFGAIRSRLLGDRLSASTWCGLYRAPATVRGAIDFFALFFGLFILRTMVLEPFRIPSSSMLPTLSIGDFVLVKKSAYAVWTPLTRTPLYVTGMPERGDVIVFSYPPDLSQQYVKRVVGLPGDKITYRDKKLTINSRPVRYSELPEFQSQDDLANIPQFDEYLAHQPHRILLRSGSRPIDLGAVNSFPDNPTCAYNYEGFSCVVPAAKYFVMGDNRDNSSDSRYWGYVPAENIAGKVWVIWANTGEMGRVGRVR
jgi:signal peptidase I